MDEAARQTGIDRVELRRRNMIHPAQMPYRNAMDKTYDSGQFELVMDRARAWPDWRGFDARAAASKARGRLRGRGLATFLEWTGADVFEETVTVTVAADDGDGESRSSRRRSRWGRDSATTFAQLAVDVFGVPIDITDRAVVTPTGDRVSAAPARARCSSAARRCGSRAERTVGNSAGARGEGARGGAGDIEYRDGVFSIAGTDRQLGLFDLARRQPQRRIVLDSTSKVADATWPNGCHVCEVEVDPDTGAVVIDRYASVNDVGRVVNPMIVIGQLEGGAAQGIGQALSERFVYDAETGQALTASFMDYAIPHTRMIRHFDMAMDESTPCLNNAMGVKGVGELGTIGATPAVVNAVVDALVRGGRDEVRERAKSLQMPLSSERVWRVIRGQA